MNDDVLFGKEVYPDDFYSYSGGHRVAKKTTGMVCSDRISPRSIWRGKFPSVPKAARRIGSGTGTATCHATIRRAIGTEAIAKVNVLGQANERVP